MLTKPACMLLADPKQAEDIQSKDKQNQNALSTDLSALLVHGGQGSLQCKEVCLCLFLLPDAAVQMLSGNGNLAHTAQD